MPAQPEPFAAPPVPTLPDPLPLGRASVERDAASRTDPDLLGRLLADPATGALLVSRATLALEAAGDRLALRSPREILAITGPDEVEIFYLGRDRDRGYLAIVPREMDLAHLTDFGAETIALESLREVGHRLSERDVGLASSAVALAQWRSTHRHCPRCGEPTELTEAGWSAQCQGDGSVHYPRTDPAVIMAVHDGAGRLLLARSAAWPVGRRSVLAGFVEAGEGPEAAVRREVAEEVQLVVGAVQYAGAQPWPFPGSLMLGYHAWLAPGPVEDPRPDGVEITHADWFTRTELIEAIEGGVLALPMRTSIARALIEAWYGEPIPGD